MRETSFKFERNCVLDCKADSLTTHTVTCQGPESVAICQVRLSFGQNKNIFAVSKKKTAI